MPTIRHAKANPHQDSDDDSLIQPSDWNADHLIEGLVADDDPRLSDARTPTAHDHATYATDADLIASIEAHAAEPHGGDAGPHTHDEYADAVHDHAHSHAEYATDTDLSMHAATEHGLSSHALDGVYHSGAEVLPTQGQKNALSGTSGTPGDTNRYVTAQDSRLSDARTPIEHDHIHGHTLTDADIPAGIARDSEVTAAIDAHLSAATHGGSGTHPAGSHITPQPAIANVNRSGNATTQTTNLQNKLDEVIAALRGAGIIAT